MKAAISLSWYFSNNNIIVITAHWRQSASLPLQLLVSQPTSQGLSIAVFLMHIYIFILVVETLSQNHPY